jgi:hypothetical protein
MAGAAPSACTGFGSIERKSWTAAELYAQVIVDKIRRNLLKTNGLISTVKSIYLPA